MCAMKPLVQLFITFTKIQKIFCKYQRGNGYSLKNSDYRDKICVYDEQPITS